MNQMKNTAIILRHKGKSYTDISRELDIPKSTLSYWLKDIQLSEQQISILNKRSSQAGLAALLKRNKDQTRLAGLRADQVRNNAIKEILPLHRDNLRSIGCALYLGEGGKDGKRVDFTNSDPKIVRVIMKFFRDICQVKDDKFRVQLSVHDQSNEIKARNFWTNVTGIPEKQFIKTNFAISKYSKLSRRNKLPFGTIQIRIADVKLFHRINGWIQGMIQQLDNMPG